MIDVRHVNKEISGNVVLQDIHYAFEKGRLYLLNGHNGCGKTMLLRLLCRLITPSSGEVVFSDPNLRFGVIIETPTFLEHESAEYNLTFLASIQKRIGKREIDEVLRDFDLYDRRKQKVSVYSLGMKQRLALAQAVMEDPDVLLLDEPFNALDDENFGRVLAMIPNWKEAGKCIVIASHGNPLQGTGLVDDILTMNNGRINPKES